MCALYLGYRIQSEDYVRYLNPLIDQESSEDRELEIADVLYTVVNNDCCVHISQKDFSILLSRYLTEQNIDIPEAIVRYIIVPYITCEYTDAVSIQSPMAMVN